MEFLLRPYQEDIGGYYHYRVYLYDGIIKKLIRNMKYHDQRILSKVFAREISKVLRESKIEPSAVSYIPMYWYKKWVRGYDQSKDLCVELARALDIEWVNMLKRTKWTPALYKLSKDERKKRLEGAFKVLKKQEHVLIVDDLYTTGATSDQVAHALFEAGVDSFSFLTIV